MTARIPDLILERYALGELDEARRVQIEARMANEPDIVERLAAIEASNREVLAAMPTRVFVAAVDQKRLNQQSNRPQIRWSFIAPAVLAAVAILVAVPVAMQTTETGIEVTRAKGDAMIFVHRQGEADPLEAGDPARSGDVLQLSYTAAGAEYGAIFSVDGRGMVTWHLPKNGRQAVRLMSGSGVPLDHAYELDDAPEFERFVFVTGAGDFELGPVERAARSWGGEGVLKLDPPLRSTLFTVDKEGAP